jgi:hypothetical protein
MCALHIKERYMKAALNSIANGEALFDHFVAAKMGSLTLFLGFRETLASTNRSHDDMQAVHEALVAVDGNNGLASAWPADQETAAFT